MECLLQRWVVGGQHHLSCHSCFIIIFNPKCDRISSSTMQLISWMYVTQFYNWMHPPTFVLCYSPITLNHMVYMGWMNAQNTPHVTQRGNVKECTVSNRNVFYERTYMTNLLAEGNIVFRHSHKLQIDIGFLLSPPHTFAKYVKMWILKISDEYASIPHTKSVHLRHIHLPCTETLCLLNLRNESDWRYDAGPSMIQGLVERKNWPSPSLPWKCFEKMFNGSLCTKLHLGEEVTPGALLVRNW